MLCRPGTGRAGSAYGVIGVWGGLCRWVTAGTRPGGLALGVLRGDTGEAADDPGEGEPGADGGVGDVVRHVGVEDLHLEFGVGGAPALGDLADELDGDEVVAAAGPDEDGDARRGLVVDEAVVGEDGEFVVLFAQDDVVEHGGGGFVGHGVQHAGGAGVAVGVNDALAVLGEAVVDVHALGVFAFHADHGAHGDAEAGVAVVAQDFAHPHHVDGYAAGSEADDVEVGGVGGGHGCCVAGDHGATGVAGEDDLGVGDVEDLDLAGGLGGVQCDVSAEDVGAVGGVEAEEVGEDGGDAPDGGECAHADEGRVARHDFGFAVSVGGLAEGGEEVGGGVEGEGGLALHAEGVDEVVVDQHVVVGAGDDGAHGRSAGKDGLAVRVGGLEDVLEDLGALDDEVGDGADSDEGAVGDGVQFGLADVEEGAQRSVIVEGSGLCRGGGYNRACEYRCGDRSGRKALEVMGSCRHAGILFLQMWELSLVGDPFAVVAHLFTVTHAVEPVGGCGDVVEGGGDVVGVVHFDVLDAGSGGAVAAHGGSKWADGCPDVGAGSEDVEFGALAGVPLVVVEAVLPEDAEGRLLALGVEADSSEDGVHGLAFEGLQEAR